MAWTELTRRQHDRAGDKYARDLTDAEWGVIAALVPPCRPTGRPRTTDLRAVFDAILYSAQIRCPLSVVRCPLSVVRCPLSVVRCPGSGVRGPGSAGCRWRMLPDDFPPVSTVRGSFYGWRNDSLLDAMNRKLVEVARLAEGRKAQPTAGIIDSQSVKIPERGGVRGYDAGKRIKGRKRHIVTDTIGLRVGLAVHSAGIQDRDGAPDVLAAVAERYPMLRHIFADGGYAGPKLRDALNAIARWTVQIVKRSDTAGGFEILPRRSVVERTLAWLGRCRHLSKDREKSSASAEARVLIAHSRRVTRHLARV